MTAHRVFDTRPTAPITIYLQADAPDGDRASNWLPAPPGDFRPILRMYEPGDSVLDGTYKLPKIKHLD